MRGRCARALAGLAMIVASGQGGTSWAAPPPGTDREDVHSFARPDVVRVTRVDLNLEVDFSKKVLQGTATLQVSRAPDAPADAPLILDTKGLEIQRVSSGERDGLKETPLRFTEGPEDPIKGRALTIQLNGSKSVKIAYRTTAKASALQWLDKEGTSGKAHPFLFTQSEAIHARSWIPLQDSPGVRVTYGARIRVPTALTAVMSAERISNKDNSPDFHFEMAHPIPPYLIALAVGDLAFRPLGPRTGVFAEPGVVEAAAKEFVDTEKMVESVEKRFGPYRWGRYDILVLPPSFPFGGMENPMMTFATPTILAGDRSLVALVAHELAHSWSGNLVTNATWRDFWLNEGFTTYLERRVVEDLYGRSRAAMEGVLGWNELREELSTFAPRDQILHIDLAGRDPDDGMTRVPYEKGALFLTAVERAVGRERFDAYLRGYFDRFAFKSITTADFVRDLREHLLDKVGPDGRAVDLHAWLDEPGLPKDAPEPHSDRFAKVEGAARDWAAGKTTPERIATGDWSTQEWVHFLRSIPEGVPPDRLSALDRAFGLTGRGNAEVAHQWLIVAVRNRYAPADARVESFLTTIGRRKFLMPLYAELVKTPGGLARARAIYAKARPFYHPISRESVDKLLASSKG